MTHISDDLHKLNNIVAALNQSSSIHVLLESLLAQLDVAFGLRQSEAWLAITRQDIFHLRVTHGLPENDTPNTPHLTTSVAPFGTKIPDYPTLVTDLPSCTTYLRQRATQINANEILVIPLIVAQKRLGAINFFSVRTGFFSDNLIAILELIGHSVAAAIERQQMQRATELHQRELEAIHQVSLSLTGALGLSQVLNAILKATLNLGAAMDAHIFLYDNQQLSFGAALWTDGRAQTPFTTPRPDGLTANVAQKGQMIVVEDLERHSLFVNAPPEWRGAILGIPLKIGKRVVGVMNVAYAAPRHFRPTELNALSVLAAQAAIGIENARLFEQAQQEIAERERTTAALQASEEKYRILIEQSNDAIYLLFNNKYEIVNRKFEEFFGLPRAELNAPDFNILDYIAPKDRAKLQAQIDRQRRGLEPAKQLDMTIINKYGRKMDVELSVSIFPYKDGVAVQGSLRDVTERNRMEAQLRQAQRLEAVGELAGGIAHNFNNILTAITVLTNLAIKEVPEGSSLHNDLTIINSQAERAALLVSQLLSFSRRKPLSIRPLNLNKVVLDTTNMLQQTVGEHIELQISLTENIPYIAGDYSAIEQILTNLAINARDEMPEGGTLLVQTNTVELDEAFCQVHPAAEPGQYITLSVSDTGRGIDEQGLSRIFDPFYNTNKGAAEDVGLGLAMVFGLTKQLDGFIETQSQLNKGTTFTLYFPTVATPGSFRQPTVDPVLLGGGQETILLIESDPVVKKLLRYVLEKVGYTVVTNEAGASIVDAFKFAPQDIDLVITDTPITELVKQEASGDSVPEGVRIPRIIFTNIEGESEGQLPLQSAIIKRPFSPVILTQTIRQVLDKSK